MRISDWSSDVCSSDLIVVGPGLGLGRSAHSADAGRRRQFVAVVIAFPAFGAGIAAGDAIDERILVDGKLDHMVKLHALGRQQRIERLGLGHGARKPVENETASHVGLVEPFGQYADEDRKSTRLNSSHYC